MNQISQKYEEPISFPEYVREKLGYETIVEDVEGMIVYMDMEPIPRVHVVASMDHVPKENRGVVHYVPGWYGDDTYGEIPGWLYHLKLQDGWILCNEDAQVIDSSKNALKNCSLSAVLPWDLYTIQYQDQDCGCFLLSLDCKVDDLTLLLYQDEDPILKHRDGIYAWILDDKCLLTVPIGHEQEFQKEIYISKGLSEAMAGALAEDPDNYISEFTDRQGNKVMICLKDERPLMISYGGKMYERDFVPEGRHPDAIECAIFRLLHMASWQIEEIVAGHELTHPSNDDEEVHALRFKKGSPYLLQHDDMDAKVLKLISGPGYPQVRIGKVPITVSVDEDGPYSWVYSMPIFKHLDWTNHDIATFSHEHDDDNTYIYIVDAYIPGM